MQIVREENAARSLGLRNRQPGPAQSAAQDERNADQFESLHPGQRLTVELPLALDGDISSDSSSQNFGYGQERGRFSATIMDVEGTLAKSAAQQCAVFLVPQVRAVQVPVYHQGHVLDVRGDCVVMMVRPDVCQQPCNAQPPWSPR